MWFYAMLLHLYPASFRGEYGEELRRDFARRMSQAGTLGALVVFTSALWDTLTNALLVHLDILRQDVRYLARSLRKAPGFAFTAIAAAALGTGATTAAFTIVDHILIRPLPFPEPDRLVKLYEDHSNRGIADFDISPATFRDWKNASTSFEHLGAYHGLSVNLSGEGEPQRLDGKTVSGDIFPALGVAPLLGRTIGPEDDAANRPDVVVLSYGLWQDLYAGNPAVLGQKLLLDGTPYTVVGVMGPDFYFPGGSPRPLLWTAARFTTEDYSDRMNTFLYGIGRLKPGVSVEAARAELRGIAARLSREFPKELAHTGATVRTFREELSPQGRVMLKALLWASLCVLLIACTNLANLLLARALGRRKELAVRAALGAGRERLVRQTLTESIFLAFAGGAFGLLLARISLPLLVRLVPTSLPIPQTPSMDPRVLAFALALTFVTGLAFGVVPALRVCRGTDVNGMREGSRGGVGGRSESLRRVLVGAEIGGCVVLLVSAGLLVRALDQIQAVDPGFRADHLLTLRTVLPLPKYDDLTAQNQFISSVLNAARQLPGVTGAAYISFLPMINHGGVWPVHIAGGVEDPSSQRNAHLRYVTPGYFQTMQIPLKRGRDVREGDTPQTPYVAVVSEAFVRFYWPGQDPIGRHIDFGGHDRMVVGVVGDVRMRGLVQSSEPAVYLPYGQHKDGVAPWYTPKDLAVRTTGDPLAIAPALRRIVHEVDPVQAVSDVQTMDSVVAHETEARSVQVRVLGVFAAIALLLAAVGIHGLLSFAISARTQEIGVRMALGASRGSVVSMVLAESALLAVAGGVAGIALAFGAGRYLASILVGIQPSDPVTFFGASSVVMLTAVAASLVPALRAVRIDPAVALRGE